MHHALLLVGPEGSGKAAFALALAAAWLCESDSAPSLACGRCAACRWVEEGNHPDLRWLAPLSAEEREAEEASAASLAIGKVLAAARGPGEKAAGRKAETTSGGSAGRGKRSSREITVDQIRSLDRFLEVGAHRSGQRVIVIEPADAMNLVAANALLKRLEEPPPDTRFILLSGRAGSLPATIRSRCRRESLPSPDTSSAVQWLVSSHGLDPDRARGLLAACAGAPLAALRLADETELMSHERVLDAFAAMPEAGIVETAERLANTEAATWAPTLQAWVLDLTRVHAGAAPVRFPGYARRLAALATRTSADRLFALDRRLRSLRREAGHPLNARLLAEDVLLELQRALR